MARPRTPLRVWISLLALIVAFSLVPIAPARAASAIIRSAADWASFVSQNIELSNGETLTIATSDSPDPINPVTVTVRGNATIAGGGYPIENIRINLISGKLTLKNVDFRSYTSSALTVTDNAEIVVEGKNQLSSSGQSPYPAVSIAQNRTLRVSSATNGLLTVDGVDAADTAITGGALTLTSGQLYLLGDHSTWGAINVPNVTITGGSLRMNTFPSNLGNLYPVLVEVHRPPYGWVSGMEVACGSYRATTNEDGEAYMWLPIWGSGAPNVKPYDARIGSFNVSYDAYNSPIPKLTLEITVPPTTPPPTATPAPTATPRPADSKAPTILSASAQTYGKDVVLSVSASDDLSSELTYRWQIKRDNSWYDLPGGTAPLSVRTDLNPGASYTFRALVYDEAGNYATSSDLPVTVGVINNAIEGVPMTVYGAPKLGTVVGAKVSVRKGPSSNHDEIAVAYRGNTAYVLGYQGSWANITWSVGGAAVNAWMHAAYLNWDNRPAVPAITTAAVYVRSGPGTNYRALGTLGRGTRVELLNRRGNYYLVMIENIACYIHARYLQMLY